MESESTVGNNSDGGRDELELWSVPSSQKQQLATFVDFHDSQVSRAMAEDMDVASVERLPRGVARLPKWWMDANPHDNLDSEEVDERRQKEYEEAQLKLALAAHDAFAKEYGEEGFPDWNPAEHGPRTPEEENEWIKNGYRYDEDAGRWIDESSEPLTRERFVGKLTPGYEPSKNSWRAATFAPSSLNSTSRYRADDETQWKQPSWTKIRLRAAGDRPAGVYSPKRGAQQETEPITATAPVAVAPNEREQMEGGEDAAIEATSTSADTVAVEPTDEQQPHVSQSASDSNNETERVESVEPSSSEPTSTSNVATENLESVEPPLDDGLVSNSHQAGGILVERPTKEIVVPDNEGTRIEEHPEEPSVTGTAEMSCEGSEEETGKLPVSAQLDAQDQASQIPEPQDEDGSTRKVGFTTVEIRDYPMIVGDNPAVSSGVPITISWVHDGVFSSSVEEYEKYRPPARSTVELKIPKPVRESLLRRLHFSRQDIMDGTKSANITRGRRSRTNETLKLARLQELLELARRATMNATVRRSAKKKEREYLFAYKMSKKEQQCCDGTARLSSTELTT